MKTIFYMIFVLISMAFMLGCGDVSDSENSEYPKVVNVSIMEGSIIAQNHPIIVEFNKPMRSAEISIFLHSCNQLASGKTILDNKKAIWEWGTYTPSGFNWGFNLVYAGNCTLSVTGVDESGQQIKEFKPINFQTSAPT